MPDHPTLDAESLFCYFKKKAKNPFIDFMITFTSQNFPKNKYNSIL